ncbi:MAG: helix-turn-helix domain-containing protein [Bacilli bacterium]
MKEVYKDKYIKLGLKISYYRKLRGLTQEELAEIIAKDPSYVGQIEAPNVCKAISLDTLFDIAIALNVAPSKFLDFEYDT